MSSRLIILLTRRLFDFGSVLTLRVGVFFLCCFLNHQKHVVKPPAVRHDGIFVFPKMCQKKRSNRLRNKTAEMEKILSAANCIIVSGIFIDISLRRVDQTLQTCSVKNMSCLCITNTRTFASKSSMILLCFTVCMGESVALALTERNFSTKKLDKLL